MERALTETIKPSPDDCASRNKLRLCRLSRALCAPRNVLQMAVKSLHAYRAKGGSDERWRMHYTFLGQNVCRDALLSLSGLGSSTLQAARDAALAGKVSWSSEAERELHGFSMHAGSHNKAHSRAAYLGARAWLEWYAESLPKRRGGSSGSRASI